MFPPTTSCEALLMTHYFDALGFIEKKLEAEAMNPTETKNHHFSPFPALYPGLLFHGLAELGYKPYCTISTQISTKGRDAPEFSC